MLGSIPTGVMYIISRMEIDAGVSDFETTLEEAEEYHLPSRADLFFGTDSGTD